MRRTAVASTILLICLGLLVAGSYGQSRGGGRGQRRGRRGRGPGLAEALAKLDLPPGRQREVHRILSAQQDLRRDNTDTIAQLQDDLAQAREAGDREDVRSIRSRMSELRRGGPAARRQALSQFSGVLMPHQFAKLEEILAGPSREVRIAAALRELRAMGLNIKQEALLDKVMEEAMEKIKRALSADQRERMAQAMERPTQGQGRGGRFGGRAGRWGNMSEDQRSAIADIRQEFADRLQDVEGEERRELQREMWQKVREAMQTSPEEQDSSATQEPDQPSEQP